MKSLSALMLWFVALALWPAAGLAGQPGAAMDFVVIQPGQPGSPEEAGPVLEALGKALSASMHLDAPMAGSYCNNISDCLPLIRKVKPAWGIVSLPFFVRYAQELSMTPIASTRPGGKDADQWRLMVKNGGPAAWEDLSGQVSGTMLHLGDAASCLMFEVPAKALPFKLKGTSRPLTALRAAATGKQAGVVLDGPQFSAVGALPQAKNLDVVFESGPLPTSPVVWFGKPGERSSALAGALQGLSGDESAADLLQLLQTQGFGPPARALDRLGGGVGTDACFN